MSAAYRIEVQRNLQHQGWPWAATVYPTEGTLADFPAAHLLSDTRDGAVGLARAWIRNETYAKSDPERAHETLYMDERGEQVQP